MDPKVILISIFLPFSLISTIVYVYVLAVILRNRELREKAFFMLNVAMGVADIGTIWSIYIFHRLRDFPFSNPFYLMFGDYGILAFMCTNGFGFFFNTQKYMLLIIGFNRFTAVIFPSVHTQAWTKKVCLYSILCIMAFNAAHAAATQIIGPSSFWYKSPELLTCKTKNEALYAVNLRYNAITPILVASLLLTIYGTVIISLCINRSKIEASNVSKLRAYKVEVKLTICVILHSLVLINSGIADAFNYVFGINIEFNKEVNDVMQDILCGCNPYLLLLFSTQLRKHVFYHRTCLVQNSGAGQSPMFTAVARMQPTVS
ncbi:hypothetical protein QR680_007210 [Steinernema hermaphroditum]|uniref:G-protein coupled receptors family 1 profile domain-containing protein n=1 Tax=Steinernema hermaphroditum TaxID=289476 RepID=A0AA39HY43_9BILA|nr:hypothetical protein QR680_007210 [Steinernema hermaphroditum]